MRSESSCRTAGAPSRRASGCVLLGVPGAPLPPATSSASSASCSLQMAATPKSSSLIRGAWRTRLGSAAPTPASPPPPPPPLSRRPRRHGTKDARLAARLGGDAREADEGREHEESRLEVESREEVESRAELARAELARDEELLRRDELLRRRKVLLRRKEVRGEVGTLSMTSSLMNQPSIRTIQPSISHRLESINL